MSGVNWVDLGSGSPAPSLVEADVCVIGAGAAGIYLATQLVQRGRSVVLIEAGPKTGVDAATVGFDAIFGRDSYPGATSGRFFGMGGSTTRWGGLLIPHSQADRREPDPFAAAWSHILGVVREEAPSVLRNLGYQGGVDFESFAERTLGQTARKLADSGLSVKSGLYLPFRRKNLVSLLKQVKDRGAGLRVFFNAVAKEWDIQPGSHRAARISQLKVVARNGHSLRVRAGQFALCAGAIESSRILLEMRAAYSQPVLRPGARPGCYLGDHLSLPIADVAADSRDQTVRLFAPRFSRGWMRGFRFLETGAPPGTPRAFTHFIFENRSPGFELAKTLLGALQQRRLPPVGAGDLIGGVGDLLHLAYGRLVESRLFIPPGTEAHLQLDMEQLPVRENRVSLSDRQDDYGRRIVRVDWAISEQDIAALAASAQHLLALWPGAKAGLPALTPRPIVRADGHAIEKPYDAYHPVGTCRMGEDKEAVVDSNLKVWGLDNLWLLSTGVLPSAGSANPTFTMLCLGARLTGSLPAFH
jgi:choline dehydrogenase-like flavoprotein